MHLLKLFLLLGFFASTSLKAQSPESKIDPSNIDYTLLESLVNDMINSHRASKNKTVLIDDAPAYLAAQNHSEYLLQTSKFTHNQRNSRMKSADKRLLHFGGKFTAVAENITLIYLFTPFYHHFESKSKARVIETYQDAAYHLYLSWIRSPSHYKNLISKEYRYSGLAVRFDKASGKLLATQVFVNF